MKTAWAQYENISFSTDLHGAKAHYMHDIARAQREMREERVSIIGRGSMIGDRDDKVWKGKKPKNIKELREWCKRHGDEPDSESMEDDEDLYPDDSSTSASDSKKRRMI